MSKQLRFEQRLGQRGAVDADERRRGARTLIVNQPDDELLAGAALAVDEHRRVQRRHTSRELQRVLHGLTACDEVLRFGVALDAIAQQVQLAFAPFERPLTSIQLFQPAADRRAQAFDLVTDVRGLEVGADRVDLGAPRVGITSYHRAMARALSRTRLLAEVDLPAETRAREPAGYPANDQHTGTSLLPK
ncbi:MAG: hypothetical protein QM736_23380 [Vicinamibacterales bacterium]